MPMLHCRNHVHKMLHKGRPRALWLDLAGLSILLCWRLLSIHGFQSKANNRYNQYLYNNNNNNNNDININNSYDYHHDPKQKERQKQHNNYSLFHSKRDDDASSNEIVSTIIKEEGTTTQKEKDATAYPPPTTPIEPPSPVAVSIATILFVSFWPLLALLRTDTVFTPIDGFDVDMFMALKGILDASSSSSFPVDDYVGGGGIITELPTLSPAEQIVGAIFGPPQ